MNKLDGIMIQKALKCLVISKENVNQNLNVHCDIIGWHLFVFYDILISMIMQSSTVKFHIYSFYMTIF